MSVSLIMNGLVLLAIILLVLFTGLGIYTYVQDRKEWKEIALKANASGIRAPD